jgi:enterochelin esterase-like enzyme
MFTISALAQNVGPLLSPTMEKLRTSVANGVPNAEEEFFASLMPPIIEPIDGDTTRRLVTFVFRGKDDTKSVTVLGGRPASEFDAPLENLAGTHIWYRTERLPSDSRFAYFFNVNLPVEKSDLVADLVTAPAPLPDPLNRNEVDGGSFVVLPDAPSFPFKPNAAAPQGQVVDSTITSKVLGADIQLKVYLPAGHSMKGHRPWLLVAFDGGFHDMAPVLDDLIARKKVPPIVVVGVVNRQGMRTTDLGYSEPFAKFVAGELLPFAHKHFHAATHRARTIIGGQSRGGGMAAFVGLQHAAAVGNVLCVSTAIENEPGTFPPTRFWLRGDDGWIVARYLDRPRLPLRFFVAAGRFDTSLWTDRLVNNRRFRDMLRGKGYPVTYFESFGGHDSLFFQLAFAEGLTALTAAK